MAIGNFPDVHTSDEIPFLASGGSYPLLFGILECQYRKNQQVDFVIRPCIRRNLPPVEC
jgi:hypothetical protein